MTVSTKASTVLSSVTKTAPLSYTMYASVNLLSPSTVLPSKMHEERLECVVGEGPYLARTPVPTRGIHRQTPVSNANSAIKLDEKEFTLGQKSSDCCAGAQSNTTQQSLVAEFTMNCNTGVLTAQRNPMPIRMHAAIKRNKTD
jgi:hypothetical protein